MSGSKHRSLLRKKAAGRARKRFAAEQAAKLAGVKAERAEYDAALPTMNVILLWYCFFLLPGLVFIVAAPVFALIVDYQPTDEVDYIPVAWLVGYFLLLLLGLLGYAFRTTHRSLVAEAFGFALIGLVGYAVLFGSFGDGFFYRLNRVSGSSPVKVTVRATTVRALGYRASKAGVLYRYEAEFVADTGRFRRFKASAWSNLVQQTSSSRPPWNVRPPWRADTTYCTTSYRGLLGKPWMTRPHLCDDLDRDLPWFAG